MKLRDLDRAPSGSFPLQTCLRWLETLLRSPDLTWTPAQFQASRAALAEAEALLHQEFSPNVTREDMRDVAYLDGIVKDLEGLVALWTERGRDDDTLALINRATNALRAMNKVAVALKVRVAFIGWPGETYWNAGTTQRPKWIPDWRDEIALIEAARHGTEPGPLRQYVDTVPWNQIPTEYRPQHIGEGALRLTKLHLVWLHVQESMLEGKDELTVLRHYYEQSRKVFNPLKHEGPVA